MPKKGPRQISAAGQRWIAKRYKQDEKSSRESLVAAWHQRVDMYNRKRKIIYKKKQENKSNKLKGAAILDQEPPARYRSYMWKGK